MAIIWFVLLPIYLQFGLLWAVCMVVLIYGVGALLYTTGSIKESWAGSPLDIFDRSDFRTVGSS